MTYTLWSRFPFLLLSLAPARLLLRFLLATPYSPHLHKALPYLAKPFRSDARETVHHIQDACSLTARMEEGFL